MYLLTDEAFSSLRDLRCLRISARMLVALSSNSLVEVTSREALRCGPLAPGPRGLAWMSSHWARELSSPGTRARAAEAEVASFVLSANGLIFLSEKESPRDLFVKCSILCNTLLL